MSEKTLIYKTCSPQTMTLGKQVSGGKKCHYSLFPSAKMENGSFSLETAASTWTQIHKERRVMDAQTNIHITAKINTKKRCENY